MSRKEPLDRLTSCAHWQNPVPKRTAFNHQVAHGKSTHQAAPGHKSCFVMNLWGSLLTVPPLRPAEGYRREEDFLSAVRTLYVGPAMGPAAENFNLMPTERAQPRHANLAGIPLTQFFLFHAYSGIVRGIALPDISFRHPIPLSPGID